MPKIFLTGSNDLRGFVTGSGYISNPSRVLVRERDNQKTNYPTVKRLGDALRKGDESLDVFDDNYSIAYADKLSDEFNFSKYNEKTIFLKNVNSSLWEVSNSEKVRRDVTLSGTSDFPGEGSFVFEGAGSSGKRWIKTKSKIKNPTVSIDVYQGPYDINLGGLNLNQGSPTDILKIQTSIDGSTWEDVFINLHNVNNEYFLDVAGGYLKPFIDFSNAVLQGNQNNPGLIGISQTTPKTRPMCNISLSMREFNNHGNQPFYLRIVQDAISDSNKRSWAIGKIDIISRNKPVTYPVLLSQTIDHERRILSQSIASPNQLSNLTVDAASISGISNDLLPKRQDALSPYTDKTRSLQGQTFYNQGVDPKILPGFSSPVLSKTKFEIDLSTNEETKIGFGSIKSYGTIGIDNYHPLNDIAQPMMCYWNKDLKRWETIGGLKPNLEIGYNMDTQKHAITSSMSAFTNASGIASGSDTSTISPPNITLNDNSVISSYLRPTDTFGFPFSGRYYATSSQYIKASEIGINKDFLLEKIEIEYSVKFKNNPLLGKYFQYSINRNQGFPYSVDGFETLGYLDNNFFILRQSKGSNERRIAIKRYNSYTVGGQANNFEYSETLPGYYDLDLDGIKETYVDETRELVTYAQNINMFKQSSGTWAITTDEINEKFADRDNIEIINYSASTQTTGSFKISSKCRITPVLPDMTYVTMGQLTASAGGGGPVFMKKQKSGRSAGDLSSDSRGIVNQFAGFKKSNSPFEVKAPKSTGSPSAGAYSLDVELPVKENIDLTSPYIIRPNDNLIFGWATSPGNRISSYDSYANQHITFFGKSKLTLYGSQIQNGVEFHDGLNQQLSTNSVYEIIGSEPVVDQFQIATRQELTGSLFAALPIANIWTEPVLSFGTGIFNKKYFNYTEPFRRINLLVYDTTSGVLAPSFFKELFWKNQFNTNLFDMSRDYIDSLYSRGKYLNNSLYGTMDSLSVAGVNEGGYQLTKSGNLTKITLNPMYVFNNSHFGYYSDMIIQGRDSRFIDDPSTSEDDIVTKSPIKIQFVRSEYDDTGLDVRAFFAIRPSDINNTSELTYQSSNLSLYATSSLPFFDDGIVKNRSYVENEVLIS